MDVGHRSEVSAVFGVLADLSPSAQQRSASLTIPLPWFRWLPARGVRLFLPTPSLAGAGRASPEIGVRLDRHIGEELAAVDRIRPGDQHSLRAGWLFVAGRRPLADGRMQRVFHPLLSVPVRIVLPPLLGSAAVWPAGDVSVTELVTDPDRRHQLEATYEHGGGALDDVSTAEIDPALLGRLNRLHRFAAEAAEAAGFLTTGLRSADDSPEALLRAEGLSIVAGVGIYTASETSGLSAAASLRSWAGRSLPATTASSALYLARGSDPGSNGTRPPGEVIAPFPLTPTQRKAVSISRGAPVSLVSGAPGTGKSHAVSAIACDAVARGATVLVAAKTDAAVDALLVLFGERPGPTRSSSGPTSAATSWPVAWPQVNCSRPTPARRPGPSAPCELAWRLATSLPPRSVSG